jgi:hypothetical protein
MSKPGITLVKRFTYRGSQEEWSNRYHFTETAPASDAAWKTLVDAVIAQEKTVYSSDVKVVRAYCFTDTDNDAVTIIDYTALGAEVPGTFASGGVPPAPGDDAMWIRWGTGTRTSKGKPIYLRKYFHNVFTTSATVGNDAIQTAQKTALTNLGTHLKDGTISGFTLCGPTGAPALAVAVSQFSTTRTLKRRRKRSPSP